MIVLFYSGHHVIVNHPVDLLVGNYFEMYCKSEQFMWEEGKLEDRIMVINIP